MTPYRVWIGWDPAEMREWNVAQFSANVKSTVPLLIRRVSMLELQAKGLYTRPTETKEQSVSSVVTRLAPGESALVRGGVHCHPKAGYWDVISEAPMSTGHAIARFLVPYLAGYVGWALFTDGDVLVRKDLGELFAMADPRFAVQVVKHEHQPVATEKMQGHAQTVYHRKNWSSVMLFQCGHPSNYALTPELVNTVPGRDLHRFCWLKDEEIGTLPAEWNYLSGVSPRNPDPALVHYTLGTPAMPGFEHGEFSDEWWATSRSVGYRIERPAKQERVAV